MKDLDALGRGVVRQGDAAMKTTLALLRQLIGNRQAYAVQHDDGSWHPVREPIDDLVLYRHLSGDHTIGTYVLHGDKARTMVVDIDTGDLGEANAVVEELHTLGLPPHAVAIEESGRKGYHVWVVANAYMPARDLRRLGQGACALAHVKAEVFPKQDAVRDLGNLIKLPGGIHRVTGRRADFVTEPPVPVPPGLIKRLLGAVPEVSVGGGKAPEPFHCMARIQEGVPEGGRNQHLFHLAVMCRRGGLNDENTAAVVRTANERSDPPLDEVEVTALLESSKNSGPLCRQLESSDVHCGENCILTRVQGLYTRPGQVKYATEGEHVVLQVGKRTTNLVELEHPDLVQGKGAVK